jgi:outer membrane biosynthesis protein TonB
MSDQKNMRRLAIFAILAALLSLEIRLAAQDQTPPGVQTPPDQSAPGSQSQPEPAPAAPPTSEPSTPQSQTPPSPTPNPANHTRKPVKKKKPGAKTLAPGQKVVVRNGGAKDQSPQLSPGMSKQQELHSRETTARLWDTTDANLKSVAGRQMTPAQQSVLDQIHTYLRQSKAASDSGDLARAHTLAYKAHLLSDELRK